MADHELGRRSDDARPLTAGASGLGRVGLPQRLGNPLVLVVARTPVSVRTKLLVGFALIVAVLVTLAVLGLRVLGQSNARVESLGTLQLRAATYQTLQTQAGQLRQLLAVRAVNDPQQSLYAGRASAHGAGWILVDEAIAAALSQLGPATNESRFGFSPPPRDRVVLRRIRSTHARFAATLDRMLVRDRSDESDLIGVNLLRQAIARNNELGALTDQLASTTRTETDALIAKNAASFAGSRNAFVVVGVLSVALALLLGVVLSRSLIDPIRRTEARLAEIARGDFSRHVEVPNRDELGALAVNLNRMNDELRRLYDELQTVSRHKSQFLANMSHELRTPLNAVIGFSDVLQQQLAGDLNERQLGYVEDVRDAGLHLLSLINDILDLSKIEAGKMELDLAEVSLRTTLESGLTMHAERANREGIALGLRLDPEEIAISADQRKLRQVVFNLLSNAVTFTPPGGRVDVSAQMADGVVEVAVADTGPGIPSQDQELIFEEFRQAHVDSGSEGEGTGLGLPLARKFIELHGGRLWVESILGEGSTFRFTLPARQAS
jgi:signal transduction histidine kinase